MTCKTRDYGPTHEVAQEIAPWGRVRVLLLDSTICCMKNDVCGYVLGAKLNQRIEVPVPLTAAPDLLWTLDYMATNNFTYKPYRAGNTDNTIAGSTCSLSQQARPLLNYLG